MRNAKVWKDSLNFFAGSVVIVGVVVAWGSISPTFYAQLFCTKVLRKTFLAQGNWRNCAHKILVKLTLSHKKCQSWNFFMRKNFADSSPLDSRKIEGRFSKRWTFNKHDFLLVNIPGLFKIRLTNNEILRNYVYNEEKTLPFWVPNDTLKCKLYICNASGFLKIFLCRFYRVCNNRLWLLTF
jgi:hypothetical protein